MSPDTLTTEPPRRGHKFSDVENTINIDTFFSKQKSSEKSELQVDEQSENRPSSSNMVIYFVVQSESTLLASTTSAESQFTHVAESETWFQLRIHTLCITRGP